MTDKLQPVLTCKLVQILKTKVSQGSVAACLRCGGIFSDHSMRQSLLSLLAKEFCGQYLAKLCRVSCFFASRVYVHTGVSGTLYDKRHRQGDRYRPRRNNQGRHVTRLLCTAHAQRVRNPNVAVQRDGAQVHYGRRRQDDVTSGPSQAHVQSELPAAGNLR